MYTERVRAGLEDRPFMAVVDELNANAWPSRTEWECHYTRYYCEASRYERFLPAYFDECGRENTLVLLHDDLRTDESRRALLESLAMFLQIDTDGFTHNLIRGNVSATPRSRRLDSLIRRARRSDAEWVRRVKSTLPRRWVRSCSQAVWRMNQRNGESPPIPREALAPLREYFAPTTAFVRAVTGRDLPSWTSVDRVPEPK
jgi:hypothetical protein